MSAAPRSKSHAAEGFPHVGDDRSVAAFDLESSGRRVPSGGTEEHPDLLATIESEIIPRLMLAHRSDPISPTLCAGCRPPPTDEEISDLADLAARHDLTHAMGLVEALCRQGLSLEQVLLELVAPAARLLGEQWKEDLRSFTEVSAGLGTLQQLVHILGPSFAPALPHRGLVVLLAAPGEQHTLGLYVVGEFLRRAGWGVQIDPAMSRQNLIDVVSTERVEMVGITVSNTELLRPLAELIASARHASRNQNMAVMLGGSVDLNMFAAQSGASLCVSDPREAVRWLERRAKFGACRS